MNEDRLVEPVRKEEDYPLENTLRPRRLMEFIGQQALKENLTVFITAAKQRQEPLDHVLFHGYPGLGKTSLAAIISYELGVNFRSTSGPVIERSGDLAAILTNLESGDVLFIDEIHRLNHVVEEILYPAMEDFKLDIIIGQGPSARTIKLDLPPFTLVGATTRAGLLSPPLRDRFGVTLRLEFYSPAELRPIVLRSARILGIPIDELGVLEIAKRSRGTPRIANRLLRRVRDYAEVRADGQITRSVADLTKVDQRDTTMAIIRWSDTPMRGDDGASLRKRFPEARTGPRLDLGPGWEPCWTWVDLARAATKSAAAPGKADQN